MASHMSHSEFVIDDEALVNYLADALPPEGMAAVEKALRQSAELRERLETARTGRGDAGLHSLGAIWRRSRLTCISRRLLGSYLLDALDPKLADYIKFHLEVIECGYCRANLSDLKSKSDHQSPAGDERRKRYFHSSKHLLKDEV